VDILLLKLLLTPALAQVGLALATVALVTAVWGNDARLVAAPGWLGETTGVLGAHIPNDRWVEIATAAVVPLARLDTHILDHCRAGHVSAEAGHRALLQELELDPLLDLGMRLGEASGATLALGLLKAAVACHAGMATFAEAGVSGPEA